jgi:hypothetical protein
MGKSTIGVRALARLAARAPSTVCAWAKRDDWPFGPAPWPAAKLSAIKAWAAELQEDRAADGIVAAPPPAPLSRYPSIDVETPEIVAASEGPAGLVASALLFPAPALLPIEAEIIRGKRALTPHELRGYVLAAVHHRAACFASILDGGPIARAGAGGVQAAAHADAEFFRALIRDAFGTAAAGVTDDIDDEADDAPNVLQALDAYDQAKGGKSK